MAARTSQTSQQAAVGPAGQLPSVAGLKWKPAAQPDIVRAAQKDDVYLAMSIDACQAALMRLCGPVTALHLSNEVRLVATFMYYALTTGVSQQTLGEEYCDVLQLHPAPSRPHSTISSSKLRSTVLRGPDGTPVSAAGVGLTLLQSFGPYLVQRLVSSLGGSRREELQEEQWDDGLGPLQEAFAAAEPPQQHNRVPWAQQLQQARQWLRRHLPALQAGLGYLNRLHLAAFYLSGVYYQWSKRVLAVRYTSLSSSRDRQGSYEVLGWMLLAQLAIYGGLQLSPMLRQVVPGSAGGQDQAEQHAAVLPDVHPKQPSGVSEEQRSAAVQLHPPSEASLGTTKQCPLCLSSRSNTTCTPCGHLFCWHCIASWCLEKPECPLCRAAVVPSQLVCVYHSDL